jgi:hypothetical protein
MQWSCPHCGVHLAISDETLGTGWSFSRCYKCGGFALVRKTEINVIKVDKAPPGEKVLLPEASGDPTNGLMSEKATQKYVKHTLSQPKVEKQIPKATLPTPPQFVPGMAKVNGIDITATSFPEPLPEIISSTVKSKAIPAGITLAALLAIGSGVYLYIQGQALWHKARESALNQDKGLQQKATAATSPTQQKDAELAPTSLTVASNQKTNPNVITDQVQQSAMAPLKAALALDTSASAARPDGITVKLRTKQANLYSGPGTNYPIVGTAMSETQYFVSDWNDRWFKLIQRNGPSVINVGWIRNDLIQILPAGSAGSRVAAPNLNPLRQ